MPDMGDGEEPAGSLLEGLVAVMPDALVGTHAEFRVTVWSAGAERLYGYAYEQALGRFARAGHAGGRRHHRAQRLRLHREGRPLFLNDAGRRMVGLDAMDAVRCAI